MNRFLKISKYIGTIALSLFALCLVVLVCLERLIAWRTPTLELLGDRVREADVSLTFEYNDSIQRHLHQIATEFGISQFVDDWLGHLTPATEPNALEKGIGASGFLFAGLQPQNGVLMIKRFDHFLDSYLIGLDQIEEVEGDDDTYQQENAEESEIPDDDDEYEMESTVAIPLQQAVEALWNSGFLNVGGAIELDVNFVDRLRLGASFLLARDEAFLRSLAVHSMPLKIQQSFVENIFDRSTFRVDKEKQSGIYFGNLDIDGEALETLFETLCPEDSNGFDACSYLSPTDRATLQQHMATLVELLNDEFEATLHFYWSLQGKTLVFANRSSVLKAMIGKSDAKTTSSDTPLIEPILNSFHETEFRNLVAENATLASERAESSIQGLVSGGANLSRLQDNILTMFAMLRMEQRRQTLRNQDLLSTPKTEDALSTFEESILNLSGQFKKVTFAAGIFENTIVPMLWTQPNSQIGISDAKTNAENLLGSSLGRLLYPQSKNISRSLIPMEHVESTERENDDLVFTRATISTKQISPIVQKRFRNLPNPSRSEL